MSGGQVGELCVWQPCRPIFDEADAVVQEVAVGSAICRSGGGTRCCTNDQIGDVRKVWNVCTVRCSVSERSAGSRSVDRKRYRKLQGCTGTSIRSKGIRQLVCTSGLCGACELSSAIPPSESSGGTSTIVNCSDPSSGNVIRADCGSFIR